jgi:hypothetical protein
MQIILFWDVIPCILVERYHRFELSCYLHYITEDGNLYNWECKQSVQKNIWMREEWSQVTVWYYCLVTRNFAVYASPPAPFFPPWLDNPSGRKLPVWGSSFTLPDTPHSSGRVIGPSQRPLSDSKQHRQETDTHAYGGIRNRCPSKWAAVDPRLRPRYHCDRRGIYMVLESRRRAEHVTRVGIYCIHKFRGETSCWKSPCMTKEIGNIRWVAR